MNRVIMQLPESIFVNLRIIYRIYKIYTVGVTSVNYKIFSLL